MRLKQGIQASMIAVALIAATAAATWKICGDQRKIDVHGLAYSQFGEYAQTEAVDWAIDNAVENKHVEIHIRELTRILTDYEMVIRSNFEYIRQSDQDEEFPFVELPFSHIAWIINGDEELQAPGGYRYRPQAFAEDGVIDEREKQFLLELQQDYHELVGCLQHNLDSMDAELKNYWSQLGTFSRKWSFWNVRRDSQAPLDMDSPYFPFVTFD